MGLSHTTPPWRISMKSYFIFSAILSLALACVGHAQAVGTIQCGSSAGIPSADCSVFSSNFILGLVNNSTSSGSTETDFFIDLSDASISSVVSGYTTLRIWIPATMFQYKEYEALTQTIFATRSTASIMFVSPVNSISSTYSTTQCFTYSSSIVACPVVAIAAVH